jgi:hypothetical protein
MRTVYVLALFIALCICSDADLETSLNKTSMAPHSLHVPGSEQSDMSRQHDSQKAAGPRIPSELGTERFDYFWFLPEHIKVAVSKKYMAKDALGDFNNRGRKWTWPNFNKELEDLERVRGKTEGETIKKRKQYIRDNFLLEPTEYLRAYSRLYTPMLIKCGIKDYLSNEKMPTFDLIASLKWYCEFGDMFRREIESYFNFKALSKDKRNGEMFRKNLRDSIFKCQTMDDILNLAQQDDLTARFIKIMMSSLTLAVAKFMIYGVDLDL